MSFREAATTLSRLTPRQLQVLYLRACKRRSVPEVAKETNCQPGTIKSHQGQALRVLGIEASADDEHWDEIRASYGRLLETVFEATADSPHRLVRQACQYSSLEEFRTSLLSSHEAQGMAVGQQTPREGTPLPAPEACITSKTGGDGTELETEKPSQEPSSSVSESREARASSYDQTTQDEAAVPAARACVWSPVDTRLMKGNRRQSGMQAARLTADTDTRPEAKESRAGPRATPRQAAPRRHSWWRFAIPGLVITSVVAGILTFHLWGSAVGVRRESPRTEQPSTPVPAAQAAPQAAPSDPGLPFSDDFSSGLRPEWRTIDGNWQVVDGMLTDLNQDGQGRIYMGNPGLGNFVLYGEIVWSQESSAAAGIVVHAGPNQGVSYIVYPCYSRWVVDTAEHSMELASYPPEDCLPSGRIPFRIEYRDGQYRAVLGDQYEKHVEDATLASGDIALWHRGDVKFDNIRVMPIQ